MSNMRKKVLTALAGATLALTGCAAEQPSPGCYVQDGTWTFRYANRAFGGNCSGAHQTGFQAFEAEQTGVFKFREAGKEEGSIVIRPRRAGTYGSQDTDPSPTVNSGVFPNNERSYATGALPAQPTGDGTERFCNVGAMSVIDVPSINTPGANRKYTFTDVKVYAGARSLGTQLIAKVQVEDTVPAAGAQAAGTCTMTADVYAVWPAVPCTPEAMDNASADPVDNCGFGSLMNQDIQYACAQTVFVQRPANPAIGDPGDLRTTRCVPANPTPSYKPEVEELEYAD